MNWALDFFLAACLTVIATWLMILASRKFAWVDTPVSRSMHDIPTPSGGGVAIAIVTIGIWSCYSYTWGLMACGAVVALIGFIDDLMPLPIWLRLLIQMGAVGFGLYAIGGIEEIRLGDATYVLSVCAQVVVGVACIWFLNLYNFMDGIDGIAASELVFVSLSALVISGELESHSIWSVLGGVGAGFLIWNATPAKIFMGDAGSGFVGYIVGLSLVEAVASGDFSIWTALVMVAPFACDATVTLLRRIARGEKWYQPHVLHAYQRLARRYNSHGRVVGMLTAFNAGVIFPVLIVIERYPSAAPIIAVSVLALISGGVYVLGAGARLSRE